MAETLTLPNKVFEGNTEYFEALTRIEHLAPTPPRKSFRLPVYEVSKEGQAVWNRKVVDYFPCGCVWVSYIDSPVEVCPDHA